jgi:hypothetical protein
MLFFDDLSSEAQRNHRNRILGKAISELLQEWCPDSGAERLMCLIVLAEFHPSSTTVEWMLDSLFTESFRGYPGESLDIHLEILWRMPHWNLSASQQSKAVAILDRALRTPEYSMPGFLRLLELDPARAASRLASFLSLGSDLVF